MSFVSEHPVAYMAPGLASMIVQSFQTGWLVELFCDFLSRSHRETLTIRVMVVFVTLTAIFQTITAFLSAWRIGVVHFGDWTEILQEKWPDKIQTLMTASLAAPFQAFLIRRCWMVTNRSWFVLVPLTALLFVTTSLKIYQTIAMFGPYRPSQDGLPTTVLPSTKSLILGLILSAVLDISLTTIIFTVIWRARSCIYSRRFRRTIRRVVLVSWESAAVPSACAVTSALLYIIWGEKSAWYLFFQAILGKLYAMSFLITLNARLGLCNYPSESSEVGAPAPPMSMVRGNLQVIVAESGEGDILPITRTHHTIPPASEPPPEKTGYHPPTIAE
ncbi:hypothetical protein JAAARDRAFT_42444 [Jaapia argillacea MUCL 33604]|uniref:DUF6534 domain-containing protein n=1 Tax=Jaapia argillacea MUCL 33604 TaxID=933084 RepID=A0A067PHN9_9AGAM|nr:hypothetical protein JAAARDRAFT_42444 [Jaapia argillacea MUCL 33604]